MNAFKNRGSSKKYHKKSGKKTVERTKDTKGFWEYSHFQKIQKPNEEEKIKGKLSERGGFDPHKTQDYINRPISKEEVIEDKIENNQKLNSSEKIIIENYYSKKKKAIDKDLKALEDFGLNAEVKTDEGRKRKLLRSLEYLLNKNDESKIAHIYLKLKDEQFLLSDELKREFSQTLKKMNEIVKKIDLVELQMTKLHSCQPPLDQKGFIKLDSFQVEVINNLDNGKSTIVSAPTSAGKSVISNYHIKNKLNLLVILPTDVLAWQHCAYYSKYIGKNVPLITKSYQSTPKREELLKLVNSSSVLVGTADDILDYLPLVKVKYDWVIFDEIHMIGEVEGSSMEHIAKLYSDKKFLALSATIGNIAELKGWFESLGHDDVSVVKCDKRFFNLQRYVYDNSEDTLKNIHPLGMIDKSDFEDKSVMNKSLQPTPPDIWDFAIKLSKVVNLGDLNPKSYFDSEVRITLDMSNDYFRKILEKCVSLYKGKNIPKINSIIDSYQQKGVKNDNINLMQMLLNLKNVKKCPAIIFQENSTSCMRLVRQFAKQVENAEREKYPGLISEREKEAKKAKKIMKEQEKKKIDDIPENKMHKMLMKQDAPVIDEPDVVPIQEPHADFIFNEDQIFSGALVENWSKDLKKYFPNTGDDYHWLIIMLWRGVGVYVKGLPDTYLRLVQELASSKKLSVVFSDVSLVFGVSMPFRTTVILRDVMTEDTLNSMMYQQMAGRAGRRGLDKEGNVIFGGYSWDRIKELSISSLPKIKGTDTMVYPIDVAKKMAVASKNNCSWDNLKKNFLHERISNEAADEFYDDISENFGEGGGWDFAINGSRDLDYMVWKLRKDIDCITIPMLIPEFRKIFDTIDPKLEKYQVEAALFLSHFCHLKEANDDKYVLPESDYLSKGLAMKLKEYADNLGIEIPEKIDSRVFNCITENKLIDLGNEHDNDRLRDRLFDFSEKVKNLQHYFFHSNFISVTRLLGKLLTRVWWIYHGSSPLMKDWKSYDDGNNLLFTEDSDDSEYEDDSEDEESEDEESEDGDDSNLNVEST